MAEINNTTSNTLISGTSDADSISNSVSNVTIDGGGGADSIDNYASSVSIDGGTDNDYLKNRDWNNKYVTVRGNDGNDTIRNVGSYSTLDGGAGNDSIYNWSNLVSIAGGAGKDSIFNSHYYETGNNVTLNGNEDDDYIYNWSDSVSINGGEGNDSLYNNDNGGGGSNVTITGGKGDDYIYSSGKNVLITYVSGDGNDTVIGFNDTDTLQIGNDGKGVYSTQTSDNNIVVIVEDNRGKITLSGAATLEAVNIEGILANIISNSKSNTLINGTSGKDFIHNYTGGDSVTIIGRADNDSIWSYGKNVSINSGDGDDHLDNRGNNVTVNGGNGNDFFHNDPLNGGAASIKMDGGAGNDTLRNFGEDVTMLGSNGNDLIYNFDKGYVDGKLKFENKGKNSSIDGGDGDDSIDNRGSNVTITGGIGNDSIVNSGASVSIDAGTGNDSIYNSASNTTIIGGTGENSICNKKGNNVTIDGGTNNDIIYNEGGYSYGDIVSINGGAGDDSISNHYGVELTIDGGAGNDTIQSNDRNNIINGGAGDDFILNISFNNLFNGHSLTIAGGIGNDFIKNDSGNYVLFKYAPGDGNDTIYGFNTTSTLQISDGNGTYSSTKSGDNVIITVDEGKISLMGAASLEPLNILGIPVDEKLITLTEKDDVYFTRSSTLGDSTILALGGNDSVYNNVAEKIYIDMGAGNDTITNGRAYSTLLGGDDNDTIDNSGGATSINGGNGNDSIYNSGTNVSVNGGVGNDSIENRASNVLINGGDDNDTVLNTNSNVTINGGNGADSLRNDSASDSATIHGDAGNDTINNNGSNALIFGDKGDDFITMRDYAKNTTIEGGTGNDSISLANNSENDLIIYKSGDGNDSISNFKSNDTISFAGDYYYTRETVGSDVVISLISGGAMTLKGASGETINIVGGIETVTSSGGNTINNTVSGASVKGTAYDDTIINSGSNVTINALKGNDSISLSAGSKNNTFVYAQGDGYDTISGFKANDTVSIVGSSNYTKDSIDNDVVISLKGGSIILADAASLTSSVKINGGKEKKIGGVKIENNSTEYLLSGTDGRDTLSNFAGGATIQGGSGNDSIYNSTKADFTVNDGLGYVTIDGGAGNDTIFSYDPNVSISGGANADLISLRSSNFSGITINAGTGNDTIYGNGNNYGVLYQYAKNDGNDTIYNFGSNDTLSISGAAYTSEIVECNVLVSVEGGGLITLIDAKDKDIYIYPPENAKGKFITNSNDNTLISGSKYADTIKNYGDNVTISAGDQNDTIYNNKGDRTSINAGSGNDSIDGNNDYVTVSAGKGKDIITGNHWRSKLSGDADNDLISITTYWYNTLDGGAGDDTIIADGSAHSVNGGANADLISLSGDALTVAGGTGDDTIYGNTATSHLYEYGKGDGNDVIYNYGSNDSITISGSTWTTSTSGKNVIVKVANSGNITLMGAKGKTLNIYPSKVTPSVESGVTAQDVIKKFMGSLDTTSSAGKAALDEAVSVASGGYFTNIGAAIEQMTLDCAAAGNATTFLKDYCGIILDNDDTGAISGSDAGGSKVKTKNSIVPEEGSVHSFTDNSFTAKGLTVQLAQIDNNGNYIRDLNYADLENERQRYIWQALETWWVGGALDLIEESYGDNFGFGDNSSAPVKKIYIGFVSKPFTNTLATTYWWWNGSGDNTKLTMSINMNKYDSIIIDDLDGKRSDSDSSYLDRTLAHEFTHAVMAANIKYFKPAQFIKEGSAELTHGIDDERGDVISYLGGNAAILNNSLNLTDTGTGMTYAYAGGYMFLRYLAKQGAEHYTSGKGNGSVSDNDLNPDTVTVKGKLMTLSKDFPNDELDLKNYSSSVKTVDAKALVKGIEITGNTNSNSIVSGSGNDTVFANVGNDTLRGGAGDDALCGEAGNDKLYGNEGDDILNGGTGNDTLTGGDGNDIFVHVADNDFIADYTAGKDKIKLVEGNIVGSSVSGSNVILNLGMYGLITVKGGKGKEITVIDSDGKEKAIQFITDDNSSKVTLGSSVIMADATARTKAIRLTGNALNNSILGGSGKDTLYGADGNDYLVGGKGNNKLYGQNGNDTLWGGAGNDTLKGGDGDDLFIYSAGNDVITDYAAGDKISLGAAISKSSVKGSDATFTIGKNTLTVKDGFRKELVFIDSSGTERTIIGGAYLADDSASSNSTLAAWRAVGDATDRTKAIKLTGNESNNTILGGTGKDSLYGADGNDYIVGNAGADKLYGQNGNDTLWGGIGNDTLKGGAGADVFIYNSGEGKDVISDFDNDDMLQITGKFSASYNSSKKTISFKVDSTSSAIKLKNFTATTFNVNGTNYHISGSKLVKA